MCNQRLKYLCVLTVFFTFFLRLSFYGSYVIMLATMFKTLLKVRSYLVLTLNVFPQPLYSLPVICLTV